LKKTGFNIVKEKQWLINPVYEYKFGWKPKTQFGIVNAIPFIRNFFTTGSYYLVAST
jgi:hypothetical protein